MEVWLPQSYHEDSADTRAEYPEGHYVRVASIESLEARLLRAFATAISVDDARGWSTGKLILKALREQEGFNGKDVRSGAGPSL